MIRGSIRISPPDLASRLETIDRRVFGPEFQLAVISAEGIAKQKVSGPVLRVQTGRLRASITHRMIKNGPSEYLARIGSNVEYAAIHELGGTIPAHRVVPVKARALRFVVGGAVVFARYANIPAIQMPERPYLRPAAQEALARMEERLARIDLVKGTGGRG
jgi:phage gpG-like protein